MRLLTFFVLLFFTVNGFSQTKNYEAQWKKINELYYKKNLPKSALTEVKKLYSLAKKEKQDAQVIKSLVYIISLQEETREENKISGINEIENEIKQSKEPAASILKSLLANQYWQYFQNNRWKFYDRSKTVNFKKEDIATWSLEDFHKKISELYLASIKNGDLLKQTKLEAFDAIILTGNVRYLRPTLYDLLAHEAIDYFKNDERDITKPAYAFEIKDNEAFAAATQFVSHKFVTRDSLSLQHKALLIYQELISFHLNDAKPDALIDVDIARIEFVYQNSVSEGKDSLYKSALENLTSQYGSNKAVARAWFLLASYYEGLAATYDPLKDTTHRFARIKAKEILERIVKDSSEKTGAWAESYNLLNEITRKDFSFQIEKVNLPGQPFRALVSYTNIRKLFFRVVKAEDVNNINLYDEPTFYMAYSERPVKSWGQAVPATNDLQQHSVEIKINALKAGKYLLLAASDSIFNGKISVAAAQYFYVSNISFINHDKDHFVLHRQTGQPLASATVNIWKSEYNYKTEKTVKQKTATYKTNSNGFFKLEKFGQKSYDNYMLQVIHNGDSLFMDDQFYNSYASYQPVKDTLTDEEFEKQTTHTYFFTDRSIYRPGQTIHFKGINIANSRTKSHVIRPGFKTIVYLRNANYEIADSMNVTANEFASFSGKFTLPQNVLNGQFTLQTKENRGVAMFSIEEYKRPKFYVDFEKVKDTYKVYDTISLTGFAKAYSGNDLDGAKVSYRVVRQPRYLYPWLQRGWWSQPTAPIEITHGQITTDKEGKFVIRFAAMPDKTIDKKTEPLFDYTIYADVTDINGETRSNSNTVTAGYKSLVLKLAIKEKIELNKGLKELSITTENLNGEFQPATIQVKISKVIPESRLIRHRLWEQPDQFVMSKEEFISFFPNDEFKNELDKTTWQKELMLTQTDSVKRNGVFSLPNDKLLTAGHYEIEVIAKDKDGQEVKDIRYIELFDPAADRLHSLEYLWTKGSDKAVEPGEKDSIYIGSSAENVFLVHQRSNKLTANDLNGYNFYTLNKNDPDVYNFYTLNKEKKPFVFTATEADRGGYGINFFFVKNNRFYQFNDEVDVPWSNKELQIEYATFRDKTLPGSEEKWKVKIKGYKGEKLAAEMLASMYDASLDQFKPHNWKKPGIWSSYNRSVNWSGDRNFTTVSSEQRTWGHEGYKYADKVYDQLFTSANELEHDFNFKSRWSIGNQAGIKEENIAGEAQKVTTTNMSAPVIRREMRLVEDLEKDGNKDQFDPGNKAITNQTIQPRKNFNETAFFFPDLRTDAEGNIEFSFTAPEALTRWKLQTLAHTKELAFGISQKELITQKELMVQPNPPRFLRQGDRMEFSVKIVNLSDKEMTGQAELQLVDATTNESVDGWFMNTFPNQYFTVAAGGSEVVKFPVQVPYLFNNALTWRVIASSPVGRGREGPFSDGEEMSLPVLTNKMLVTETLPLPMRGSGTKNFVFKKLTEANSESLQHHALTVEYTSNPAWYAVQALPYLMEFPYECAEQIWNRYYANALASSIINKAPRIKQIFERWKTFDTAALLSNLSKNQELKSALLEETPWVMEAKTEEQQKKNIALLFDMVRMNGELASNLQKLKQMQLDNGAFPWFKGGQDDRYITQYILTGIGHLKKLGVETQNLASLLLKPAIAYLDKKIKQDYDNLKKYKADLTKQQIGYYEIQYLYMRSFFSGYPLAKGAQTAYSFYYKQSQQFWTKHNKQAQGMIALTLHRKGEKIIPSAILKSLKETSINHEELGMYWKENQFGYSWYWWSAPIETQSLMIEAFHEISKDNKTVDDLRTWLIKNKQTNNWRTTKATAEACYAMLLQGTDWISKEPVVQIKLGNTTISNQKDEAGTGYFKKTIDGEKVQPGMGNIALTISDSKIPPAGDGGAASWGSVYWQYFEDLDKIIPIGIGTSTPLQLNKKLFIEKNTDRGPVLTSVDETATVKVGDKIKVRIELRVDRDMEYVHMKDMRASSLEPTNVLSGYKWQEGLGYYVTTKDASTNFFFNILRKGTYVFEYSLFVTHAGNFSNGVTSIQCMYAPEFSSQSEGIRINIE